MKFYPSIKKTNRNIILIAIPRTIVVMFVLFQILGMYLYPGGTILDSSTRGYSFVMNFFSDMGAYAARNGEPNYLSMIIFAISLSMVGCTFSVYYIALPNIFGNDRLNFWLSTLGTFFAIGGSICMIGTGFTPTDLVYDTHVLFANNIFHFFLITALAYTIVIYRSGIIKIKYVFGYGLFFISILIYVLILQYGPPASSGQSALIFQVTSQKIIVIIFCGSVLHQTFGFEKIINK